MRNLAFAIMLSALPAFSGCAVYMAANQPDKRDVSVLQEGTYRGKVLAELGQPVSTETRDGQRVDVFNFVQGYSDGAKVGRAALHAAADVFTLGLWEVVGTPIEAVADGSEVQVEVFYDAEDNVEEVKALKGEDKLKPQETTAEW
ncbi:MAG: hypothetical protein QNJ82_01660 [Gammaproteobacteria bacterium]|nr:hypothetical protein [Gammaproteobacteria bacterium]